MVSRPRCRRTPFGMDDDIDPLPPKPPWLEFASAPLVPFAIAATVGPIADRALSIPVVAGVLVSVAAITVAWLWRKRRSSLPLWIAVAAIAATAHQLHRFRTSPDDIALLAADDTIDLAVRGVLLDDPVAQLRRANDPLAGPNRHDIDRATMDLLAYETADGWRPLSGIVRLRVEWDRAAETPSLQPLRCGDTVQLSGRFSKSKAPSNPGELDPRERDRDRGIRGELRVAAGTSAIVRLEANEFDGQRWLGAVRRWASETLTTKLGDGQSPVARTLLLGDGAALDRAEWDRYVRTGTVHVLAISGQHLVMFAGFLWLVVHLLGMPRSRAALLVAGLVFAYALLTGLRPSALRAAVMVASASGALILRRPVHIANSFALAWLAVIAMNPADIFDLGCRLSFLSVFVLVWGAARWFAPKPHSPVEKLIAAARPTWLKWLRAILRAVGVAYAVNAVLFVANAPLLLAEQNIASPIGLLIGPWLVLLSSLALLFGFALLLFAFVPGVGDAIAFALQSALALTERSVALGDAIPGGSLYAPGPPPWWLLGYYTLLIALVLAGPAWPKRLRWAIPAWVLLALLLPGRSVPKDECRIAFLAVGHGSCIAIEAPDGRVLLYDAGSLRGSDAARRIVAPYLWHRGIRRIDDVFLSHADVDHFNGLAELVRRFPIGGVGVTSSFADKPTAEVDATILSLAKAGIPMHLLHSGQSIDVGDVDIDVLHPPESGLAGTENERSLVLKLRHAGHVVLLTGDLEKRGTSIATTLPSPKADVVQAPHHGSRVAYPPEFRSWAGTRLAIATRGDLYRNTIGEAEAGVPVLDTHAAGAITVRTQPGGIVVESFLTGERIVLPKR